MLDSLAVFESRKQALETDPGMLAYFQNRIITANDSASNDTTLNTDSVGQWASYRGYLGISLPAGSPMDTFSVDTNSAFGDTMGLTIIPIFVYVTLRASATPGLHSIFNYGKSGPGPDPLDTSLNIDQGDFTFFPVQVGPAAVEKSSLSFANPGFGLDAFPNPAPGSVSIRFQAPREALPAFEVYSMSGALIKKLGVREIPASGIITWDGLDQRGARVHSGTYVLRLHGGGKSIAKKIQIIR
jgi:hypothetical protein